MNLNDYQRAAYATAIYPEQYRVAYPMLKLMGELGELGEVLDYSDIDKNDLIKECGDVMWYVAALCTDLGIDLESIPYENRAGNCYHQSTVAGMRLCETLGKKLRDGKISDDRSKEIPFLLGNIIEGVTATLRFAEGTTLHDVLVANIKKLTSRQERGTLTGDGDNR